MKRKILSLLMALSISSTTLIASVPSSAKVVKQQVATAKAEFIPYINGLKVTNFDKIKKEGLKLKLEYYDYSGNTGFKKVFSEFVDNKLVAELPRMKQGIELRPENMDNANEFGFKVKSADYNFREDKVPVFTGIDYSGDDEGEPYYIDTTKDPLIAINYELKYDLKINLENLTHDLSSVKFKLFDHDKREVKVESVVENNSIILKNIEYNPMASTLRLVGPTGLTLEKNKTDDNLIQRKTEQDLFDLNVNFNNAIYESGKNPVIVTTLKEKQKETTKPIDIKDINLRKKVYEKNRDIVNHFPNDVDKEKSKKNYDIFPSQIEYIKEIQLDNGMDLTGIENLSNITMLSAKGASNKALNLSAFPKMQYLELYSIGFEKLDLSNLKELISLKAKNNNLTELILPKTDTFNWLDLSNDVHDKNLPENNFNKGIDFSNVKMLKYLNLSHQKEKIEKIDVSSLKNLEHLSIDNHKLKTINLKNNPELQYFSANNNFGEDGLTEIDLTKNPKLQQIHLKENHLKELNLGKKTISGLNIYGNEIKTLDLSNVSFIKDAYYDHTQKTKINAEYKDGKFIIDMNKFFGTENISKILFLKDENISYNERTGILTLNENFFKVENPKVVYKYNTGHDRIEYQAMRVEVSVKKPESSDPSKPDIPSEPETHINKENKDIHVEGTEEIKDFNLKFKKLDSNAIESLKNKNADLYDIYFENKDAKIVDIKKGKYTVTIKKSKTEKVKNVYYVKDNGKLVEHDFEDEIDKVKFHTTHFSKFAIVYESQKTPENKDKDKDKEKNSENKRKTKLVKTNLSNTSLCLTVLAVIGGVISSKKKK